MMMRNLFAGGDYRSVLKKRAWMGVVILILGGLVEGISFTVLPQSALPDFVKGFYPGMGLGLLLCALWATGRSFWLLRHPGKARAAQIKETDEREQAKAILACKWAFYVSYLAIVAAMVVVLPFSLTVFWTLLACASLMTAGLLIALAVAERRI